LNCSGVAIILHKVRGTHMVIFRKRQLWIKNDSCLSLNLIGVGLMIKFDEDFGKKAFHGKSSRVGIF